MKKEDLAKMWKKWLIDIEKSESEIARQEGITQPTLNEKFRKGTVPFLVFENILEKHGYKFKIVKIHE